MLYSWSGRITNLPLCSVEFRPDVTSRTTAEVRRMFVPGSKADMMIHAVLRHPSASLPRRRTGPGRGYTDTGRGCAGESPNRWT